ncbi:MAG: nicotinate-nucleotide--dimethylbenzimidazole phosphoribosyltransferase [Opitutaceae bacterium]|nr:nicotinate-nucleotide--dimethylbenzimidazole phosphoribosyltransferase [Opitutaceae bacterium]
MNWQPPIIPPLARQLESELRYSIDRKTKPLGSLGRLEELALQLGLIQQTTAPVLRAPTMVVFAGDHGLAAEGVSPYPAEVTAQMVLNYLAGGAAINVFARQHDLTLKVVDAGVAADLPSHPALLALKVRRGTRNALREPALTPAEVSLCLERGAQVVADLVSAGTNALLLGEMGIGNTSAAALLHSALLGLPLDDCVGRGAGHDDAGLARKRSILARVQARHAGTTGTPMAVLAAYGGCEIAMLTGAILAAAAARMVIVIDGFIVTSALLVAAKLQPVVLDYCVYAHTSSESGHARALAALKARPLLDLGLRLGEGTGAALAWPLIVSAAGFLREMATFDSAGVSERGRGDA